jgi:hypothetical protein
MGIPIGRGFMGAGLALALVPAGAAGLRAEVQMNLCAEPDAIIRALDLRPEGAAPVEAWYFDSPALGLFERGVVVRLRRGESGAELTIKVADQDCPAIDPALLPPASGKCEYDLHGADLKGAVSLNNSLDEATTRALLAGDRPLAATLSSVQARYLQQATAAWPLPAGIRVMGPVHIQPYRAAGERYVVEMWQLPTGRRYTEISRKTAFADAMKLRGQIEAKLAKAGVPPCADQSSQAGSKLRTLAGLPVDAGSRQ